MRGWLGPGVFLACSLCFACGGPKYTINVSTLSDLPLSQQQPVIAAQNEINRAAAEKRHYEGLLENQKRDMAMAQDGLQQAQLEVKKAQAVLALAQQRHDEQMIQYGNQRLRLAQAGVQAAQGRIAWLNQRQQYYQQLTSVGETRERAAKARYELALAQVAVKAGRAPSTGFSMTQYEEQAAQAQSEYEAARTRALNVYTGIAPLGEHYNQLVAEYDELQHQVPGPRPAYQPSYIPVHKGQHQEASTPGPQQM